MEVKEEEKWDLEIKPVQSVLDFNFPEIWRYRDLLWLFVKRDFTAQYKQTILGPVWHIVQPVLTTIMFLLIFSRIAKIPTDYIAPVLFYMSGITMWNYFASCLTSTSNTFLANAGIFGKVYFPRLITPLALILSNIIRFGIQFMLLLAAMIWYNFHGYPMSVGFTWLYIPFIIFLMAGISLGLGIIVSSLTTKYRDFSILLAFIVQLGMYATPVVYPLSYLKNSKFGYLIKLNPLTPLLEAFKYSLFGKGTFTPGDIAYTTGFMVVALFLGLILFTRIEKSFMDTV